MTANYVIFAYKLNYIIIKHDCWFFHCLPLCSSINELKVSCPLSAQSLIFVMATLLSLTNLKPPIQKAFPHYAQQAARIIGLSLFVHALQSRSGMSDSL